MIVEPREPVEHDALVRSSARFRWGDEDVTAYIAAPAELADRTGDASGFFGLALPLAMRAGEDLDFRGPVSPRLLAAAETIHAAYLAMDPGARPAEVRVEGTQEPESPAGRGRAAFFSRGVDSLYTAATNDVDRVVFVDRLDPRLDADVRTEELRRAEAAAQALGTPLAVVESNVRDDLAERLIPDWEDVVAAGLGAFAHALAGGLERAMIASSDTFATLEPCGTSPVLDPLFSSERMEIEHDTIALNRAAKLRWLAENRPELLEHVKVCFAENRPDNCGRCGKCLLTMAGLRAAGALERAHQFPDEIDLEAIAELPFRRVASRRNWMDTVEALEPDDPVREAVLCRLRRVTVRAPAEPGEAGSVWVEPRSLRDHRINSLLSLLVDGRPYPRNGRVAPSFGLVRALDRASARHVYGVGRAPAGELVGELGALHARPEADSIPAWLTADGRLVTGDSAQPARRPTPARTARWALAPLGWREEGLRRRLAAAAWRLRHARRAAAPAPAPPEGEPTGWLHLAGGLGRVPLYAAEHPVTGDQLLATWPWEPVDLGYGRPRLIGYLEASAPVTGTLGTAQPLIPWASRYGRRIRSATPPSGPPSAGPPAS